MRAISPSPPRAPDEEITGLSCPECFGVLGASVEGAHRTLRFRCRIGHAYTSEEVIVGKEEVVENHLWAAVTALNELATFLRELAPRCGDEVARPLRERAALAMGLQEQIRGVLDQNERIGAVALDAGRRGADG